MQMSAKLLLRICKFFGYIKHIIILSVHVGKKKTIDELRKESRQRSKAHCTCVCQHYDNLYSGVT